jgi:signal transduction histidine kinase/DNA-binding response OmpR family regulator/HPt (histidine-containing phosphotransfer) domain-containing protein
MFKKCLKTLAEIAAWPDPEWSQPGSLQRALAACAQALGADHGLVAGHLPAQNGQGASFQVFAEWSRVPSSVLFDVSAVAIQEYAEVGLGRWPEVLGRGQDLLGTLADLPTPERDWAGASGARSVAVVPVLTAGRLKGFIALRSRRAGRGWTRTAAGVLRLLADLYILHQALGPAADGDSHAWRLCLSLLDQVQFGLAIIDQEHHIRWVNTAARVLLGADPNDRLEGALCHELLCQCKGGKCAFQDLTQVTFWQESNLTRLDGQNIPVAKSVSHLTVGEERLILESFTDTCALQAARQEADLAGAQLSDALRQANQLALMAEEANLTKSNFLANMSHEIRTPMNAILGMTRLVLDSPLNSEQRENLNVVQRAGDSLLSLINNLLDLSKIESERFQLEDVDFDLHVCLDEVLDLMAPSAYAKQLELFTHRARSVPRIVRGDPVRLRQILLNLFGNAVKFTLQGWVAFNVEVTGRDEHGVSLAFSVEDTGIGIPRDKLDAVFESFTQADPWVTRKFGGTGLGLTISKDLAALMGGRIEVKSEIARGSEFTFRITLPAPDAGGSEPPLLDLAGLRVLVAAEHPRERQNCLELLRAWGARGEEAGNGPETLERLSQARAAGAPFGLVLLDSRLCTREGPCLASAIRELAQGRDLPVVLLANPLWRESDEGLAAKGIRSLTRKPVRVRDLGRAVAEALGSAWREPGPAGAVRTADGCAPRTGIRVLLAEDNELNRKLMLALLERRGCKVHSVTNGEEALSALDHETFDLVLMDVQMPVLDGLWATSVLRSLEVATGLHVPVVAMTAHALRGDRERCLLAGMDDYLSKPIEPEALDRVLCQYGDGRAPAASPVQRPRTSTGPEIEPAIVDEAAALKRMQGDQDLFRTLLEQFTAELGGRLEGLRMGMEQADWKHVREGAHTLKGTAGNLACVRLQAEALALELAARGATPATATLPAWASVQREAAAVRRFVTKRFAAK